MKWQALMNFSRTVASDVREQLCLTKPCMNNGLCVKDINKPLGFACRCPTYFHGPLCEYGQIYIIRFLLFKNSENLFI